MTSDPTSSHVIHQTVFHQIYSHTKSKWHKSRQVKTQRREGEKKKIKTKKKNQTVDWRDGEMIDFLGLCSYPDTLSLLYNHNSSHRHIGRVICVRISRQIRWCWITASNHTRLPQHQIVSPFYLWITWSVNYVSEHTDLQMIWWPLCWKDIMIIPKCYLWFYKHIHIFPCHHCLYDVTKNNLAVSYMNNHFVQTQLHVKFVSSIHERWKKFKPHKHTHVHYSLDVIQFKIHRCT